MKEVCNMSSSFDFNYGFQDMAGDVASGVLGIFVGVFVLIMLLTFALAIVSYVLSAVSMYRIAKRRGIHNAWLAWIPIGSSWLLGSISDQYQYVVKRKVTSRRKLLLILGIVSLFVNAIYCILQVSTTLAFSANAGMSNEVGMVAVSMLVWLLYVVLAVVYMAFTYVAYYDLFRSCKPANAVLFLVLGIVFSVTLPFFLIACSNKDEGMPPKRPPQPPVQIPAEPEAPVETPVAEQPPVEEPAVTEEVPVVEGEVVEDPQ